MNGRTIHSVSIAASAGYGKTEILCMRLLAVLLADPKNMTRTAAMTFTRNAAGEILERTFVLLAEALKDGPSFEAFRKKLADLSGEDGFADLTREELSGLLVRLSRQTQELTVSTIDSFMVSLVEACALELGFCGIPAIVDEDQAKAVVNGVVRELFAAPSPEIINMCRESLIGSDKRTLFESCEEMIRDLAPCRDQHPDENEWGRIPGISRTPTDDLAEALRRCDENPPAARETYEEKLRPLLVRCANIASAQETFTQQEKDILNRFYEVWDIFPGKKPNGFSQNWDFSDAAVCDAIRLLLSRARDILLTQTGVQTRAVFKLLTEYGKLYRKHLWDRGWIRFCDLPQLLSDIGEENFGDLQFRMNMKFLHFLFDEFQDTSRRQWRVFSPIVQDNGEENHSTTIVGDVKQAIYNWRGGDSRLMGDVSAELQLPRRTLQRSYRSGQSICDALNFLFEKGLPNCTAIPESVRKRWAKEFPSHQAAKNIPSCFELLSLSPGQPQNKDDFSEQAAALIAERLRTLDLRNRRLECAILVRREKDGIALKEALSVQKGFSAEDFVWEGDESIAADRVNRGLLALLYYLQHPADTFSAELLRMDPVLCELLPEDDAAFAEAHARLMELGLSGFLCDCLRRISGRTGAVPGEAAAALLAAARQFEASGQGCDTAEFRDFAGNRCRKDIDLSGKVRIMTIHHSKGLTFDVTFVPVFVDTYHGHFRTVDTKDVLEGEDWLLYNAGPAALTSPVLRDAIVDRGNIRKFESLCDLYVALTRARFEVCVILPAMSKTKCNDFHPETTSRARWRERKRIAELNEKTYYPEDLLHDVFFFDDAAFPIDRPLPTERIAEHKVLRRTFGDREWFKKTSPKQPPKPADLFTIPDAGAKPNARPVRVAPSRTEEASGGTFRFPARTNRDAAGTAFGTKVHEFFEQIEDLGTFKPPAETPPEILRHLEACQENKQVVELLSGKDGELWRERRFDLILIEDGARKFVSGCFDRVQIRRDGTGKALSAVIVDYKSNDVDASGIPDAVEHYRPQMELYARALGRLLDLAPENIVGYLLFTKTGTLCRIEKKV